MAKPMTKTQIVAALAEKVGLTKKQVAAFFEAQAALAYKEAKNGFTIPGVGKLVVRSYKARMGRNPQTGEAIKIPARKRLKFTIAKAAKDDLCHGLNFIAHSTAVRYLPRRVDPPHRHAPFAAKAPLVWPPGAWRRATRSRAGARASTPPPGNVRPGSCNCRSFR